jgi:HEPN domain-containing protein
MSNGAQTRTRGCGRPDKDHEVARILHAHRGPSAYACFHCQQAAEKLLKACLVAMGAEPPRVHDLEALLRLVEQAGCRLDVDRDAISDLAQYAVAPRYPGFPDEQADADLPALLATVDALVAAVEPAIAAAAGAPASR